MTLNELKNLQEGKLIHHELTRLRNKTKIISIPEYLELNVVRNNQWHTIKITKNHPAFIDLHDLALSEYNKEVEALEKKFSEL